MIPLNVEDPEVKELSEKVYRELQAAGVDVLLDDRDQRLSVGPESDRPDGATGIFSDPLVFGRGLRLTLAP